MTPGSPTSPRWQAPLAGAAGVEALVPRQPDDHARPGGLRLRGRHGPVARARRAGGGDGRPRAVASTCSRASPSAPGRRSISTGSCGPGFALFGTSGSEIRDMKAVLGRLEAGRLDTSVGRRRERSGGRDRRARGRQDARRAARSSSTRSCTIWASSASRARRRADRRWRPHLRDGRWTHEAERRCWRRVARHEGRPATCPRGHPPGRRARAGAGTARSWSASRRRHLRLRPALVRRGGIGGARLDRPLVLGHEAAGVIASRPRAGARVAIDPSIPVRPLRDLCPGAPPPLPGRPVPGPQRHRRGHARAPRLAGAAPRAAPDTVDDVAGAILEPLGVAIHALRLADPRRADRSGSSGRAIGRLLIRLAQGGRRDHHRRHRPPAAPCRGRPRGWRRGGAGRRRRRARRAPRALHGRLLDTAIEIAGDDDAIETAATLVRPAGTVVIAGIPPATCRWCRRRPPAARAWTCASRGG